jgi:cell division protein FtsZ
LFNVTGGPSLTLYEVNQAAEIIKTTAHPDVNLIFGAVIDENMKDDVRITVIATGFDQPTPIMLKPAAQTQAAPRPRAQVLETVGARVTSVSSAPVQPARSAPVMTATVAPEPPAPRQPVQPELPSRVFNNDSDLDIPPFLRNPRSKTR